MTLGEYINRYLNEHNMSMRTFASRSGVSHTYISYIINGRSAGGNAPVPTIEKYRSFASAMGMNVNELIRAVDDQIAWGGNADERDARRTNAADERGKRHTDTADNRGKRYPGGRWEAEPGLTVAEHSVVYDYRDADPAIQEAAARMLRESAERERKKKNSSS